jgi:hypothetical protein
MCGFLHQCHDIAEIFLKLVLDICKTAIFYLAFWSLNFLSKKNTDFSDQ